MIAHIFLIIAAAVGFAAGARMLAQLKDIIFTRRIQGDSAVARKKAEIEGMINQASRSHDSATASVIKSLNKVENAVVVVGDQAIVKNSIDGKPKTSVEQLSSHQRELIIKHEAPVEDAAAFRTWLGNSDTSN